jgi:hypothetical protein
MSQSNFGSPSTKKEQKKRRRRRKEQLGEFIPNGV